MLGNIGTGELLLIFVVVLLVFGAKRIPEIARGLGRGIREFKEATREISRELDVHADHRPVTPRPLAQGIPAPHVDAPGRPAPEQAPGAVSQAPPAATPGVTPD